MDFYTRKQAAAILGVTPYTISNYIKKGILKNYGKTKSIMISCEDIHTFYEKNNTPAGKITRIDFLRLENKISSLGAEVQILKLALGMGASVPARTDEQLKNLYHEIMKLMMQSSWTTKEIFRVADMMISLRDSEIARWLNLRGTRGWTALFELSERMLYYIKGMAEMPKSAADIIIGRIEAGRNRLYGLVFVSLSEDIGLERYWAKKLSGSRAMDPTTDDFVIAYIRRKRI